MKKRLDVTAVTNELKGSSLFFANKENNSPQSEPNSTRERVNTRTHERPNQRTTVRPNARTPEHSNKRTDEREDSKRKIKRHSFQFFEDQITALHRLRAQMELAGQQIDLSAFVREAIDSYLHERTNARTGDQTTARTGERTNKRTQKSAT